jgi:hypothetical protein
MSGKWIRQRTLDVPGIQETHSAFKLDARPARQLPQDLLKHVAGVPHVVEGTTTARTLRVLRIKGPSSRWLQKRSIPPQRTVGGAGVDVVVA